MRTSAGGAWLRDIIVQTYDTAEDQFTPSARLLGLAFVALRLFYIIPKRKGNV